MTMNCDVAVIGAGTAGLAAERSARQQGARTLLIDDRFAGTTCATVGCMPSKLLIAAADAAHAVRRAAVFGIKVDGCQVEGRAVLERVRRERDLLIASVQTSFAELPAGIAVRSHARFVSRSMLALDDGRQIAAGAIVIATGAAPSVPKTLAVVRERVLTNETLFELSELPASVGVIGAGPLGLELAQALHRLGVDTWVFDAGTHIGALRDQVVGRALHAILAREFPITLGVNVDAVPDADGVRLSWQGSAAGSRRFERLLVAAGRPPRLEGLGLQESGLELDAHGVPLFDRATRQCGDSCIFIAGDAGNDRPVLHEALDEGALAGRNAAGHPRVHAGSRSVALAITFTDPPAAAVGVVPEADEQGTVLGCASYEDQGRAKVFARNAGRVHLYADSVAGRLTGATLVGPGVEHTAHLMAWAVQQRLTAGDVLALPFYHPTYEEGVKSALQAICHAVHARPSDRDDAPAAGA